MINEKSSALRSFQLVNKPQNRDRYQRKRSPSSNVESEFFDIHCSKLKPDPFAYLGEASDECVTHTMFFFGICEAALDRFFSLVIEFPHSGRMTDIFCLLHIIRPDMLQDCFLMIFAFSTFCKIRTVFTYIWATLEFFVSFTVR